MKKLALILALFLPMLASAQSSDPYPRNLELSWTNTDSYVDGTSIEAGDLTGVRIECFRHNETAAVVVGNFPASGEGLDQSEVLADAIPRPGSYTCYGYSIVIGGIESDASNPITKKYVGKPNPPATFRFTFE